MPPRKLLFASLILLSLAACENGPWRQQSSAPMAVPANIERGEAVEVQPGDTVYAVARRYKVPMNDIIVLNGLRPPFQLKPGSKLTLPAKQIMTAPSMQPKPEAAPVTVVESAPLSILHPANKAPAAPVSEGINTYHQEASHQQMVDSGEKKDVPSYSPGSQKVMRALAEDSSKRPVAVESNDNKPMPLLKEADVPPPPEKPEQLKPPVFVKQPAAENVKAQRGRFIWPVKGSVVSNFGNKEGGQRNDGINISVPFGAPVAAADGGTVAYAGSEIPGYGNVVIIRHADGYMTTYAHLERIVVDKDSVAAKGDIIGTVGTTGGLSSPQLHFEIRKGAEALDPSKYLSKGM